MATESSEGEEEAKMKVGNQVLMIEDDLREMDKNAAWRASALGSPATACRISVTTISTVTGSLCFFISISYHPNPQIQILISSDSSFADRTVLNLTRSTFSSRRKSSSKYVSLNVQIFYSSFSKFKISKLVVLYVDFKLDESYTPSKISIRAGGGFHNLKDIKTVELDKPRGWVHISLSGNYARETFFNTFMLQISVLSNHLNGRDTHVRQIKLYGPRPNPIPHQPFQFTSREFITYASIR